MQVTETLSEGLKRGFTIVVPASDIESRRAARLADLGKTLRLPGFRPGKVPLPIVRQRYGKAVNAEILEESVETATRQALSDRGLRAALQPRVDLVSPALDQGTDLEFKVEVELLPDITVPDLSNLALTRLKAEVPEETVDRALGEIARRNRDLVEVTEDRGAEKGDVLSVDFAGKIDGVAFPGGTASDQDVEVAGPGFIAGFTDQLEGLRPGETRVINVTFPEDYGAKNLAGKAAEFEITAKKLSRGVVPALDDEFGKKIGFGGLDDVREVIKSQVQREYEQLSKLRLKRQLLDALAERADFAVPEGMVEAEFKQIWNRIEADRTAGRLEDDDKNKDEEALKAEYRGIAERRVRLGLLLSEVGRVNGVAVGNDEMSRAMRSEASRYPGQEQQIMKLFQENPQAAESLRGPLFENKVVDYIIEMAQVTDQVVTPEELAKEPDAPAVSASAPPAEPVQGGEPMAEQPVV